MRVLAALMAALAMAASAGASAATIEVLSAGAVEPGLLPAAEAFRRRTGHEARIRFATAPALRQRVGGGEAVDVVIAPPAVLDELAKSGRVDGAARVVVGKVGVGVAVRDGAPQPDVRTPEALKRAILGAEFVIYNRASTGLYLETLFQRLGIAQEIAARSTRYPDGASVMAHLIKGSGREIGFGAMTEIVLHRDKGLKLAGPLPPELQNYTDHAASRCRARRKASRRGASPSSSAARPDERSSRRTESNSRVPCCPWIHPRRSRSPGSASRRRAGSRSRRRALPSRGRRGRAGAMSGACSTGSGLCRSTSSTSWPARTTCRCSRGSGAVRQVAPRRGRLSSPAPEPVRILGSRGLADPARPAPALALADASRRARRRHRRLNRAVRARAAGVRPRRAGADRGARTAQRPRAHGGRHRARLLVGVERRQAGARMAVLGRPRDDGGAARLRARLRPARARPPGGDPRRADAG